MAGADFDAAAGAERVDEPVELPVEARLNPLESLAAVSFNSPPALPEVLSTAPAMSVTAVLAVSSLFLASSFLADGTTAEQNRP